MPTQLAVVDVKNMALDLLREAPISAEDNTGVSRWFDRNYPNTLDATLRAHPWNFALLRSSLTADPTAPAFGWTYRYVAPTDSLRILPLRYNGELNGTPIPFEFEGGYILTDAAAPLKVRTIQRIDTPGLWDPLFADALAARMAWKMAHWLTGKQSYGEAAGNLYKQIIAEAERINSMEGDAEAEEVNQNDVISIRYT